MYSGPIIDSHFHVFQRADIPQLNILSATAVQRDFSLVDYRAAMGTADIVSGVVMQAADVGTGMDELAYVERLPKDPLLGRYISYLPIDRPDATDIVEQLSQHDVVAGVRFSPCQTEDDPGRVFNESNALRALQALADHNLVYELSARPWQHDEVYRLASKAPETTFVLGHLGKPRLEPGFQADWFAGIERIAKLPNVICKVSAPLVGPHDQPYQPGVLRPMVRHAVECFGYDRVMFGSNFPVVFIVSTYKDWLAMLAEYLDGTNLADLEKLYYQNAKRVYRL